MEITAGTSSDIRNRGDELLPFLYTTLRHSDQHGGTIDFCFEGVAFLERGRSDNADQWRSSRHGSCDCIGRRSRCNIVVLTGARHFQVPKSGKRLAVLARQLQAVCQVLRDDFVQKSSGEGSNGKQNDAILAIQLRAQWRG